MSKWWIWTLIDYQLIITSEPISRGRYLSFCTFDQNSNLQMLWNNFGKLFSKLDFSNNRSNENKLLAEVLHIPERTFLLQSNKCV